MKKRIVAIALSFIFVTFSWIDGGMVAHAIELDEVREVSAYDISETADAEESQDDEVICDNDDKKEPEEVLTEEKPEHIAKEEVYAIEETEADDANNADSVIVEKDEKITEAEECSEDETSFSELIYAISKDGSIKEIADKEYVAVSDKNKNYEFCVAYSKTDKDKLLLIIEDTASEYFLFLTLEDGINKGIIAIKREDNISKGEMEAEIVLSEFEYDSEPVWGKEDSVSSGIDKKNFLAVAMHLWAELLDKKFDLCFKDLGFEKWEEPENLDIDALDIISGVSISNAEAVEAEDIIEKNIEADESLSVEDLDEANIEEEAEENIPAEAAYGDAEKLQDENEEDIYENADTLENAATEEIPVIEEINGDDEINALGAAIVIPEAEKVELNMSSAELYSGDTLQLSASLYPEASTAAVSWTSSDTDDVAIPVEKKVTVSSSGLVTVAGVDEVRGVTISAEFVNSLGKVIKSSCEITIYPSDVDIYEEDPSSVTIGDGVWISGMQTSVIYTGKSCKQDLRIYDHKKLLTEGKDYLLTYKNNINVASADKLNSPSVTITMRGRYTGKKVLYFEIQPRNIVSEFESQLQPTLNYSGKAQYYTPNLYFEGNKLVKGKDYNISEYTNITDPENQNITDFIGNTIGRTTIQYKVTGIGNYTGTYTSTYFILGAAGNLSNAKIYLSSNNIKYYGNPLTDEELKEKLRIKIKMPGQSALIDPFAADSPFDVFFNNISGPGEGNVIVSVKSGYENDYAGIARKSFTIYGAYKLADVSDICNWQDEIYYSKEMAVSSDGIVQPNADLLTLKDGKGNNALVNGSTYRTYYSCNKKAGIAKVTFTGLGEYIGSFSKTYRIKPAQNIVVDASLTATYSKGGAIPEMTVKDVFGYELEPNTDYKITYKMNKAVGIATYSIKGVGNYANSSITINGAASSGQGSYTIEPASLASCSVVVGDKVYTGKENSYASVPLLYDSNGTKLKAGVDYSTNYEYIYDDCDISNNPPIGTQIYVKINGSGNYAGSYITGSYHMTRSGASVSKLYFTVDNQIYNGKAVEPKLSTGDGKGDIHVYLSAADRRSKTNELDASQYISIKSYSNNTKVGNRAAVVVSGVGEYGGIRTLSFKIVGKEYEVIHVSDLHFDISSLSARYIEGVKTINLTVGPEDAENKCIIWSVSSYAYANVSIDRDNNIVTVDPKATNGKFTITATSQDTGKSVSCVVNVMYVQLKSVSLSKSTIMVTDNDIANEKSYSLTAKMNPTNADVKNISWTSSNPDLVSVTAGAGKPSVATIKLHKGVAKEDFVTISVSVNDGAAKANCSVVLCDYDMVVVTDCGPEGMETDTKEDNLAIHNAFQRINDPEYIDGDRLEYIGSSSPYLANVDSTIRPKMKGYYRTIYFPAGHYYINTETTNIDDTIWATQDWVHILLDKNAYIHVMPNKRPNYNAFVIFGSNNVIMSGGHLIGDKNTHKGSAGEWGHGIGVMGSKYVAITDVEISYFWGDGIMVADKWDAPKVRSQYVYINNCNIHHNRRNNISLTCAANVWVTNSKLTDASGTDPQYGIDIETNYESVPCKNILLKNCIIKNNAKAAIGIITEADNVEISGCTLTGAVYNMRGNNVKYTNDTTLNGKKVNGDIPRKQ